MSRYIQRQIDRHACTHVVVCVCLYVCVSVRLFLRVNTPDARCRFGNLLSLGLRSYFAALFLCASEISAHEVNPNILSTTGLKFEGLVFATAGSSCIAPLG